MNAPPRRKFFGERVPPIPFWVLLSLLIMAYVVDGNKWLLAAIMGLALGVYVVWSRKHDDGRRIRYSEDVIKRAGLRERR